MSRILVVEDDLATREALDKLLQAEGYQVDLAIDGEMALERLRTRDYDAIVLDIALPKVSGTEVMEYISGTNPMLLSRIVVVTGLELGEIQQLFPAICDALAKPVVASRLMNAVRRCHDGPQLTA